MAKTGSSTTDIDADWVELLRLLPGYDPFRDPGDSWFDPELAARAIEFIETHCKHIEGALAGKPFRLEPWQKAFVANLFGWVRKDAQGRIVRRYREALLYVPRKNGKTPLIAAISLYVLFCDKEAGMQGYIAAADREQAAMLFRQAKGMVDQSAQMRKRCTSYGGNAAAGQSRSLIKKDGGYLRVISADADTKHGGNSHLVVIDELHAQPNRDLVDVLSTSMASANRAQPLLISLTTADYDRPSICNEKYEYAKKVIKGEVKDPTFLPAVYEIEPDDDWTDPKVWAKANPNLGVSVSAEYLARECERARVTPAYEFTFKRLHLDLRTQSATRIIDINKWDACALDRLPDLTGLECWGGMDLSTRLDLSAVVWLFRWEGRILAIPKFYAPRDRAEERSKTDRVPYLLWEEQGWLTLIPGPIVVYKRIVEDIRAWGQSHRIRMIAADPYNATDTLTALMELGYDVVQFRQTMTSYSSPTKRLGELVLQGAEHFAHDGNPVMKWMVGHLMVETDRAANQMPSKKKSTDRIDGPAALIMGLGKLMEEPEVVSTGGVEIWD